MKFRLCRVLALAAAVAGCTPENRVFPDLPPIVAESNETAASENAGLIERCRRVMPPSRVGAMHFTHSEKWGDILRVDMPDSVDSNVLSRMVCTEKQDNVAVGVVPAGSEEPLPQEMRGVWAPDGECATVSRRAVFSATAVAVGERPPSEMRYFPQGQPLGKGVLWWTNGTWSQFVYDAASDVMQWSDKSGVTVYRRCSEQNDVPPPSPAATPPP
jgi:hypothetical protein